MRLAGVGAVLSLGIVALWFSEFGVMSGGGLAVFSFILLVFLAGFPSALSEVALTPFASTLPGSLRQISRRLEIVGWLALVNAVWLAGLLSVTLGLMLATLLLLSLIPSLLGIVATAQLTSFLLWHLSWHRAFGISTFWVVTLASMFALNKSRRKTAVFKVILLATVASLVFFTALSLTLPGGVNPGVNYIFEGGWRSSLPPLVLATPVLSVGAGMGVLFHNAKGEANTGFQSMLYPLVVIGVVFLASMAFFSSGGASGMVDAARRAILPAALLDVFQWWLASSAALSTWRGALGNAASSFMVCAFTFASSLGCSATLDSASATIREELRVSGRLALLVIMAPAAALSIMVTFAPSWVHLAFLVWWITLGACVVALVETLVVGWIVRVERVTKQLGLASSPMTQEALELVLRFVAPAALLVIIALSILSPWQQVHLIAPPLTTLVPLMPQDVSSSLIYSSAAWLSVSVAAPLTLKIVAEKRKMKEEESND